MATGSIKSGYGAAMKLDVLVQLLFGGSIQWVVQQHGTGQFWGTQKKANESSFTVAA